MLTNYSYTEYLPSVYADSTNTIIVKFDKATLYSLKVLSVHGVTMIKNTPEHVYEIKREFDETEEEMLGGECSRMVNSLISHSDAVVKVVLPKTYDQTIVDRIDGLISALRDSDPTRAFQYVSLLSTHTKNKLAEYNQEREYKSKRIGKIKPCQF